MTAPLPMAESFDSQLGLVDEIGIVLAFAFVGGFIAGKLRLPPIVGYIAAGLAVGPFTPGFMADVHLAEQLGEIGIVLLMFGVGLHFSIPDLMRVRKVAVPGAILQSLATTAIAVLLAKGFGWSFGGGLVLGLAVSVASTIVLVRALEERENLETNPGHIAVGWLIVEDMFSVLVLVLLPVLAVSLGGTHAGDHVAADTVMGAMLHESDSLIALGTRMAGIEGSIFTIVGVAFLNVAVLGVVILRLGRGGMFWVLQQIERLHSAELFTLSVVVLALLVAVVAKMVFGLSIALGAFLAGVMMAGSPISHKVGIDVRPLRDLFGVMFFTAVGMLLDPSVIMTVPLQVAAITLLIVVGKPVIAGTIVHLMRQPRNTVFTIGPAMGQIGEFSFILVVLGRELDLLPAEAYQIVIAGAIISIAVNPVLFYLAERMGGGAPSTPLSERVAA